MLASFLPMVMLKMMELMRMMEMEVVDVRFYYNGSFPPMLASW